MSFNKSILLGIVGVLLLQGGKSFISLPWPQWLIGMTMGIIGLGLLIIWLFMAALRLVKTLKLKFK